MRWETGQADYLGEDKYENIQKQIEAKSGKVLVAPPVTAEEIKIHKEQAIVSLIKQMPSPELSVLAKGPPKLVSSKPKDLEIVNVKREPKAPEPKSRESHSVVDAVESESLHSDRRHKWETGQIDYLGEDSFENILKRLDQKTKRSDQKYDRPTSVTVPIPAPTHKPATGQFAKLPDKETPYSLMQDAESSKNGSFPSQYFDEDKATASRVSGSFKLQSTAPLVRTEDISSKSESSREIPSKGVKSGTFKLQSAFGEKVESVPQGEVDEQIVVKKQEVLQKQSVLEVDRAIPLKAVSDSQVLPGHPDKKGPAPGRYLIQSAAEQDTQTKRIPGKYVFQSAGEHPVSKPAEEALICRESQALGSSERLAISPEQRKSGRSDLREAPEVKSEHVAPLQKEGRAFASESRLEEFFDPAPVKSTEYFSDVKMVKKMLLKQPDYDVKVIKKPHSAMSAAPKVVAQGTVKAVSTQRSSARLTSGVKSITVVTKARSDKK